MELQTIRQVSQDYSVSRQMLCYYEEIGLIKSTRKNDYAYRVYDEDTIKRLQQIIILRKLQIPVKQIRDILKNQDAVAAIEIFKQNISEIDEKITALSTVKSILIQFINELQKKADVHLKLDLLNDKAMLAVSTLSFPKNIIEERASMEELNKAAETLEMLKMQFIKVVKLPPATVAYVLCEVPKLDPDNFVYDIVQGKMNKFIMDSDLYNIKPDFRYFEGGNAEDTIAWNFVTIPPDFPVPAPFSKKLHPGGLYAVYRNSLENKIGWRLMEKWVDDSKNYKFSSREGRFQENFNMGNIYGLKESFLNYWDTFLPIDEIEKMAGN